MNVVFQWFDVIQFVAARQQPIVLYKRAPAHEGKAWCGTSQVATLGTYWVPQTSILQPPVKYIQTSIGEAVRIPLWGYDTIHPSLPAIVGLGVEIGLKAMQGLREATQDKPLETILIIGQECTDLRPAKEAFCCYIGVAFKTK